MNTRHAFGIVRNAYLPEFDAFVTKVERGVKVTLYLRPCDGSEPYAVILDRNALVTMEYDS